MRLRRLQSTQPADWPNLRVGRGVMTQIGSVRTFFSASISAFGRRRRLRAGASARPRRSHPTRTGAEDESPPQCGNPVPLTPDCSVTVRRLKVADAPLRDRASSNLDPPTADQVRAGCQEDGASVPISLRHRQPMTSLRPSNVASLRHTFPQVKGGIRVLTTGLQIAWRPFQVRSGVESLMGHQPSSGDRAVIPGFRDAPLG